MTTERCKELAPGIGMSVKVTNEDYVDGGYTGTISGIFANTLQVDHPSGSQSIEKIEYCVIDVVLKSPNKYGDDNHATPLDAKI